MLAAIFDWILAASLRASVLAMIVLVLQPLLWRHVSARVLYALWLPVLVVLVTPVRPASRWSIESVFVGSPSPPPPVTPGDGPPFSRPAPAALPTKASAPPPASFDWRAMLPRAWAGGTAALLGFGGLSLLLTLRRFRRERQAVSQELAAEVASLAREAGLRRVPEVWLASAIRSPAITGVLRPVLLLPARFGRHFTAGEAQLILRHELLHVKRHDLPLNAVMCLLIALHWFNPLLWLAFLKARADREAACDAQVLESAPPQRRREYGHALIKAQTAFPPPLPSLGFVGLFQRGAVLRSRIRSIASGRQTHPAVKLLSSLCVTVMTFLGITRAATPADAEVIIEARFIEVTSEPNRPDDLEKVVVALLDGLKAPRKDGKPLIAVLDDPQFQVAMRRLSQRERVDLMSTPSLVTRAGQKASIKVGREMTFPPEKMIPPQEVGVTLNVLPAIAGHGSYDVTMEPRIVEFVRLAKDSNGKEQPVLSERKAHARVLMKPGQTAVLDLGSRTDEQRVEEEGADGSIVASRTDRFTRRAIAFITTRAAEPARAKPSETGSSRGK